jgi:hypothetical protein
MDGGAVKAAVQFLLATLRNHWGKSLDGNPQFEDLRNTLLNELWKIQEDLNVLRDADKNVAAMRFTRGFDLLVRNPKDETDKPKDGSFSWRDDLTAALDSAENGYHRVKTTHEKILCFEIMCSCFLVLRPPEDAIASIRHQIKTLFAEQTIMSSLASLNHSVCNSKKPLSLEDKVLLENFFSRICAAIAACEGMSCYTHTHRCSFREIFRTPPLESATDPSIFQNWNNIQVFQFPTKTRIAGNTAHALVPIVPLLCALTTIMSVGTVRPKNAGITTLNTIPLVNYDLDKEGCKKGPNLYDFRWQLLDLVQCNSNLDYKFGCVSVSEHCGGWLVAASSSDSTLTRVRGTRHIHGAR